MRYIKTVNGFAGGMELLDKNLTFWTATVWHSEADMKAFRSGEPHKKAMRNLPHWCDEAAYAHWQQQENTPPDWDIVHEMLLAEGRLSKVKYPSIQQGVMAYPPPKWRKTQRILASKALA
ncbi:hypothetical protein BC343_23370 [Mucilaginibacter pedocola]|uniref:DUF3291 domain-containing protein n=1 Tax=Mucilaginibacter pedocola TaxID=1792845 RepID=A0A1S9PIY1_9SPHI|nr:hypothetical protein BC343_23370 [Mucilaginibacter pedocola]